MHVYIYIYERFDVGDRQLNPRKITGAQSLYCPLTWLKNNFPHGRLSIFFPLFSLYIVSEPIRTVVSFTLGPM